MVFMTISTIARAMDFHFDFNQDGSYENSWPLKTGEAVTVDIYVSNVPGPGLRSMGFKIVYASEFLQAIESGTQVNAVLWPIYYLDLSKTDEIEMAGTHTGTAGYVGNGIKLGSVRFHSRQAGTTKLTVRDRGSSVDEFVLVDGTLLDGDFTDGLFLMAQIDSPIPGDVTGDGVVDLSDAVSALKLLARMNSGFVHVNADVNRDNKIGPQEVIYILQKSALLR
jgi:hypothetical protein